MTPTHRPSINKLNYRQSLLKYYLTKAQETLDKSQEYVDKVDQLLKEEREARLNQLQSSTTSQNTSVVWKIEEERLLKDLNSVIDEFCLN